MDGGKKLWSEGNCFVVVLDGSFDPVHAGVWGVADVVLHAAAEEVQVFLAVASGRSLHDHPPHLVVFQSAPSAPQRALEVVLVAPSTLARIDAGVQQAFHFVEEFSGDEWLVTSVVSLTFVADFAEVVPVAEHPLDCGRCNRASWVAGARTGGETTVGEFGNNVVDGVTTGGVKLEAELHERRTLLVDSDGSDLSAVDALKSVEVPDRCAPEGATVLGLLTHLVGDICTVLGGTVFVERSKEPMHELPNGGFIDLLGGRDKDDATLSEVGHDDGIVESVACEAAQLVHDDRVDIAVAADALKHLLERDPLRHFRAGTSGLNVFRDNGQAECFRLAFARYALGRDGDTFRVVVGVDLPLA